MKNPMDDDGSCVWCERCVALLWLAGWLVWSGMLWALAGILLKGFEERSYGFALIGSGAFVLIFSAWLIFAGCCVMQALRGMPRRW